MTITNKKLIVGFRSIEEALELLVDILSEMATKMSFKYSDELSSVKLPTFYVFNMKAYESCTSMNLPAYRQRPHMHSNYLSQELILENTKFNLNCIKNKRNKIRTDLYEQGIIGTIHLDPCDYFAYNPYQVESIPSLALIR